MAPSLPYHVYLDLDVVNNDFSSNTPPPLKFEENRNAPFLDGSSADYFCSIVRFSIQTGNSLPVFIPKIDTAATDPINSTIYKITFVYKKVNATSPVTTTTYTTTARVMYVPSVPYTSGQLPYNYYYIFNYNDFIRMINTCLGDLMRSGSIGQSFEGVYDYFPPFMEMDPATFRCSLTVDKQFFVNMYEGDNYTAQNPSVTIYFNKALHALLPTLPYNFNSASGDLNYRLIFENLNDVNTIQVSTNSLATLGNHVVALKYKAGVQIIQEVSSVSIWNPVSSIVFTTSLLPIVPSQTSSPKIYNSANASSTGEPNIASILSDFEISSSPENQYRPDITYIPPGEYRLVDMYSSYNLNRIDLTVYWKDIFGNLNPIYLPPGCSAHVKLMFIRKHFYLA